MLNNKPVTVAQLEKNQYMPAKAAPQVIGQLNLQALKNHTISVNSTYGAHGYPSQGYTSMFQPQFSTQRGNNISLMESSEPHNRKTETRGSTRETVNRTTALPDLSSVGASDVGRIGTGQAAMLKTAFLRQGQGPNRGPAGLDQRWTTLSPTTQTNQQVFGHRKPSTADPGHNSGMRRRSRM